MAHVNREMGEGRATFSDDFGLGGSLEYKDAMIVTLDGSETDELRDIISNRVPDFLDLFIRKNSEYGENAQTLGPRGQFADIWRKIAKLKTGLWDGEEHRLTSENVDEILLDLIGHCFLILSMRGRGSDEQGQVQTLKERIAYLEQEVKHLNARIENDQLERLDEGEDFGDDALLDVE